MRLCSDTDVMCHMSHWQRALRVCVFYRLWHTACLGHDGEVFVFGGCANNLLSSDLAVRFNSQKKKK